MSSLWNSHCHQNHKTLEEAVCGLSLLCICSLLWYHHLDLPLKIIPSTLDPGRDCLKCTPSLCGGPKSYSYRSCCCDWTRCMIQGKPINVRHGSFALIKVASWCWSYYVDRFVYRRCWWPSWHSLWRPAWHTSLHKGKQRWKKQKIT